jgi:GMP synthase PP-ATPase subunit
MDCKGFVEKQVEELRRTVGDQIAINALSGGVDSSVVISTSSLNNNLGASEYAVPTGREPAHRSS